MELEKLKKITPNDDNDLERQVEIRGINLQPLPIPTTLMPSAHQELEIEDYQSESSEDVPASILFENEPLVQDEPRVTHYTVEPSVPKPPKPRKRRRKVSFDSKIGDWGDVKNLDAFLIRLYNYYAGKGLYCIILESVINLLLRWVALLTLISSASWWFYQLVRLLYEIPGLLEIKNFYNHILEIPDHELQSCLWSEVVTKITVSYSESTDSRKKLDAHGIANRIMRKDNYLIAMFNKNILDLRLPGVGERQWMTKLMQDYIAYAIFSFVFDSNGKFRKRFLKLSNKPALVEGSFFKLSEEYRQNPALLVARAYTPLASWEIREFNELPHIFNKRLTKSHKAATNYIHQFSNHYVTILARFVSFISGSFVTVLLLITLFEEEFQRGFEITPDKSAFFYIGVFGTLMAISQGMTQENIVHEPQKWMNELVLDTHYYPIEWRGNAHLLKTRDAFSIMFEYRIVILIQELLSIIFSPFILYYSLPESAGNIIEFFRTFTVYKDSVGHVCNFAVFDFERQGNRQYGAGNDNSESDQKLISNHGKMEYSFMNFKANYPDWDPGVQGSVYFSKVLKRGPTRPLPSYLRFNPMINSESPANYNLQGESVLNQSAAENHDVGREFFRLLDAFYDSNRHPTS